MSVLSEPTRAVPDHSSAIDSSPITPTAWYAIVALFVVNVVNYVDRMALSVLLPSIKADLALSDSQLGLLIGLAFSLFYAVCGIPIARWADRGVRRNIIAAALATWSLMTALSGTAQNFWQLFAARMGVGVGEAGCLAPAQSMICDYVPPRRRAGIYALHTFGLLVGMMVGMAAAGWLAAVIGWRWTFVVLGLPGIALAVVVKMTVREPTRGHFDGLRRPAEPVSFGRALRTLTACRSYRMLLVNMAAGGFVTFGLLQWWPSLYARVYHLDLALVGTYLGLAVAIGSGAGLLIGGLLANQVGQLDPKRPLIVGAVATLLAIPVAVASLFVALPAVAITCVGVTALLWSIPSGPVVANLYGSVPTQMRATAGAIGLFLTAVVGQGLGPLCVGLLSDSLAVLAGAESLRYALLAPICGFPFMTIALYAVAKEPDAHFRIATVRP
jgi:predicted MFS family arabinose efflux permease